MTITLDVQNASISTQTPDESLIESWVGPVLARFKNTSELTIRIVDEKEGTELNEKWRKSNGATNVLSFPIDGIEEKAPDYIGDIVICAPVVEKEATQQDKSLSAHWAHMVVHGTLHLLGYDHTEEKEAEIMESLETDILEKLGFDDPYNC